MMVLYFKARPDAGDYTIYMGADKNENEELIKYGLPEDVWYVAARRSPSSIPTRLGLLWLVRPAQPWRSMAPGRVLCVCVVCGIALRRMRSGRQTQTVTGAAAGEHVPWRGEVKPRSGLTRDSALTRLAWTSHPDAFPKSPNYRQLPAYQDTTKKLQLRNQLDVQVVLFAHCWAGYVNLVESLVCDSS